MEIHTPHECAVRLAARMRERRRARRWSQAELAERSGVALATLKLFEHTGKISLERLLRIASSLDALTGFDDLFAPPAARSLDDIEARAARR
jgi:transcriptional regulator with XRE-family HTH domain